MIPETFLYALIFLSLCDFHFLFFLAARKKENAVDDRLGKNFLFIIHYNRPFDRYGGHIEFIRFKEYYGIPRWHEHDPIYWLSINSRFSGQFFFKFS